MPLFFQSGMKAPKQCPKILNQSVYGTTLAPRYTMCLHPGNDFVSKFLFSQRWWPDCALYPGLLSHSLQSRGEQGSAKGVFVDVGGNIGSCTFLLASLKHRVYTFEAWPENQDMIQATIDANPLLFEGRVSLTRSGVADEIRSFVPLFEDKSNSGNNVVSLDASRDKLAAEAALRSSSPDKYINITTLDTVLLGKLEGGRIHLLKLDCQGCEYRALLGAKGLLQQGVIDAIALEFSPHHLRAQGVDPAKFLLLISSSNFTLFLPDPPYPSFANEEEIMAHMSSSPYKDIYARDGKDGKVFFQDFVALPKGVPFPLDLVEVRGPTLTMGL